MYGDRPTACRYYPVALLSMRRQDEATDRDSYALVKEPHCLGHDEPREITIADYRNEQGLPEYDELARGWRQLILKKKSSGPTIGKLVEAQSATVLHGVLRRRSLPRIRCERRLRRAV